MALSAGRRNAGQAPSWILAALVSVASISGAGGQAPRPELCAQSIVGAIDDIVNAAYDINQAALDCTLPGLDQLSCAGDLTDMMSYWFNLGNKVATLTLVCGALDNACASNILQALGDMSDTSNNLVAAAQDCTTDTWLCGYDILSAIDTMNYFVGDIIYSLQTCNNGAIPPVDFGGFNSDFQQYTPAFNPFNPNAGADDDSGYYRDGGYGGERRLKEVPASSNDAAGDERDAASAPAAAEVAQLRKNATMTVTEWVGAYSQMQAELEQFRNIIKKQKAAVVGTKAGTMEEKQMAWKSLMERVRSHRNGTATSSRAQSGVGNLAAVAHKLAAAARASSAAAARMPHLRAQKHKEDIHV